MTPAEQAYVAALQARIALLERELAAKDAKPPTDAYVLYPKRADEK